MAVYSCYAIIDGRRRRGRKPIKYPLKGIEMFSLIRKWFAKNTEYSISIPINSKVLTASTFYNLNGLIPTVQVGSLWYQLNTWTNLMINNKYALEYSNNEIIFHGSREDVLKLSFVI